MSHPFEGNCGSNNVKKIIIFESAAFDTSIFGKESRVDWP
jgi:hypothetical protein